MKKEDKDKIIQELMDSKLGTDKSTPSGDDEKLYHLLYEGLETPPDTPLSHDFADKVVKKVKSSPGTSMEFTPMALIVFFILAMTIGSFRYFDVQINMLEGMDLGKLIKMGAFMIIVLVGIQIADLKLLKSKLFQHF